jgi:hypothetical protein
MKKIMVLVGTLIGKKSFAAATAAGLSGLSAAAAGFDPLPWVLATIGMVYMFARSEPNQDKEASQVRRDAIANGLMSLIGGGLGGPWTAVGIGVLFNNPRLESPLLMAFVISAGWQFFAYKAFPAIWPIAQSWLQRKVGSH